MNSENIHFEDLWEQCEKSHKDIGLDTTSQIIEELNLKISLFSAFSDKTSLDPEDMKMIKSRTVGEILLTLTKLSLKEDINVFEALSVALQNKNISVCSAKYLSNS